MSSVPIFLRIDHIAAETSLSIYYSAIILDATQCTVHRMNLIKILPIRYT